LSGKNLTKAEARSLINNVINNHDSLWRDNKKESKPEKKKWVRSAHKTDLGKLLKLIDVKVLAPLDSSLPSFIFGGRKGMSNVTAAKHLLGYEKERTLLALDITRFFESVEMDAIEKFYRSKGCSPKISKILSKLSCVRRGPKEDPENIYSLARGFSTSTRLAVWSNIIAFYKIYNLIMKRLKGYDPRMAIFIDDIGISASRVPRELLSSLEEEVNDILKSESRGTLKLNDGKTKIMDFTEGIQHLGVVLNRNKLVLPTDLRSKFDWLKYKARTTGLEKYRKRKDGYRSYEGSLRKANRENSNML